MGDSDFVKSVTETAQGEIIIAALLKFVAAIILVLLPMGILCARQKRTSSGERMVVCMIRLEHADAEHLVGVLKPFLSPQGSLSAYAPTNTLIIKDRASIVNMLSEVIKGHPCTPIAPAPQSDGETELDKRFPR